MIVQAGTLMSRLARFALGESASPFWLSAAPFPPPTGERTSGLG
jgi:hypothetical protein